MSGDNYYTEEEQDAIEAARILESRVFKKVFASLNQEYIDAIIVMDSTNKTLRDDLMFSLKNLHALKMKLQSYVDTIKLKQEANEYYGQQSE